MASSSAASRHTSSATRGRGGAVTLSYDADGPWNSTPAEEESWRRTADDYGISESIHDHIAAVTLRPRVVELRPYLIETEAREVVWKPIDSDSPEVRALRDEHGRNRRGPYQVEVHRGESSLRVRWSADGSVAAECTRADLSYEAIARDLAAGGFRFPTSDGREYACGAGAATLFRRGDHAPCDRYPIDSYKPKVAGDFPAEWDLHRRPQRLRHPSASRRIRIIMN